MQLTLFLRKKPLAQYIASEKTQNTARKPQIVLVKVRVQPIKNPTF